MPDNGLYVAMDNEGRSALKFFFEAEDWLLKLMDRHDLNTLAKDELVNFADILSIDKAEVDKYTVIRFNDKSVDEDTLRAICHTAGIDSPHLGHHSDNFFVALKKGEELERFRQIVENESLNLDKIRSDYIDWLNSRGDDNEHEKETSDKEDDKSDKEKEEPKKEDNSERNDLSKKENAEEIKNSEESNQKVDDKVEDGQKEPAEESNRNDEILSEDTNIIPDEAKDDKEQSDASDAERASADFTEDKNESETAQEESHTENDIDSQQKEYTDEENQHINENTKDTASETEYSDSDAPKENASYEGTDSLRENEASSTYADETASQTNEETSTQEHTSEGYDRLAQESSDTETNGTYKESSNSFASGEAIAAGYTSENVYSHSADDIYQSSSEEATKARIDEMRASRTDGITDAPTSMVGSGNDIPQDYHTTTIDSAPNGLNRPSGLNGPNPPETNNSASNSQNYSDNSKSNSVKNLNFQEINLSEVKNFKDLREKFDDISEKIYTSANSSAYSETAVKEGKHSLDKPKTYLASVAFESTAKHIEGRLLADFTKAQFSTKGDSGKLNTLNEFIAANGQKNYGFATKKNGQATLESFGNSMVKRGFATKDPKTGVFDYSKLNKESKNIDAILKKSPDKRNDNERKVLEQFSKKLGFADKDFNEANIKNILETAKRHAASQKHRGQGRSDRKQTARNLVKYGIGDTAIYKGYQAITGAVARTKQTLVYIKTTAKLATRVAAKTLYGLTAGTAFVVEGRQGYRDVKQARANYREKKQAKKDARQECKIEKEKAKLQRKEDRRKERRERLSKVPILGRALSMFDRMKQAQWFANMKAVGANIGKFFHTLMYLNPVNLINLLVTNIKKFFMKWLIKIAIAGGGVILALASAVVIINILLTTVTSFFDSLKFWKNEPAYKENVFDSTMGQTYLKLKKQQEQWLKNMTNKDLSDGFFSRGNLRFTKDYLTPAEYAPMIPHIVGYDSGGRAYIANPFMFEPEDTSIYKNIKKFDGGVEVFLDGVNGLTICNIKDILCMTNEYFVMDTYGSVDTDTKNFKSNNSPETGNSEGGYAAIEADSSDVHGDEDTMAAYAYKKYATELFTASHRQYNELEYVVLPTKYTEGLGDLGNASGSVFAPEIETTKANMYHSSLETKCSDWDKGGCVEYKNFYYRPTSEGVKICIYDSSHNLRPLGDVVFPTSASCRPTNGYDDSTMEYLNAVLKDFTSCYQVSKSETSYSSTEKTSTKQKVTKTVGSAMEKVLKRCGVDKVTSASYSYTSLPTGSLSYTINWSHSVEKEKTYTVYEGTYHSSTGEEVNKDETGHWVDNKGNEYGDWKVHEDSHTETEYWIETESGTVRVTWMCQGGHKGRFCGGHLKSNITSMIYSFTDEQLAEKETAWANAVENYQGAIRTKTTYDNAALETATDIFDIDKAITHSTEKEDWEGWTSSNMQLAVLQYNQDWEDLYGFEVEDITGGSGHVFGNPFTVNWTHNITSFFGKRAQVAGAGTGATTMHQGLDIAGGGISAGTEILSVCDGYVETAGWTNACGTLITIAAVDKNGDLTGWKVVYKHIPKGMGKVNVGDFIEKGTPIGVVGGATSGTYYGGTASNGAHLHIEVHDPSGAPQNPIFYLSSYVDEEETEES